MGFLLKEKEAEASSYSMNNEGNAPPPYTSVPPLGQSNLLPVGGNAEYRAPSPSFSANAALTPRILHIYHKGGFSHKQRLMENDKTTKAYDVQFHVMSKPHIEVTSAATGQTVGTANFHFFSSSLDLTINGNETQLDRDGWFTRKFTFLSSIGKLKWEFTSVWGGTMACVTEKGEWLARFDPSYWAMKKDGKLEIVNSQLPQGLVDELVVTGITMVEIENRRKSSSASSGGAS